MRLKKRKKTSRIRGSRTFGYGARKKHQGSGHRGGVGMAGSGKRADHRKSFILKNFKQYFGKQGETSKSTKRKKEKVINLEDIQKNNYNLKKKIGKNGILNLENYKVLGKGEINEKLIILVRAVSSSAKEKIEKAGGEVMIKNAEKLDKKPEKKKKEEISKTKE